MPSGAKELSAQIATILLQVPFGTLIQAPTMLSSVALPWQEIPSDVTAQLLVPPLTTSAHFSCLAAEATGETVISAAANTDVATAAPIVFDDFSIILLVFI